MVTRSCSATCRCASSFATSTAFRTPGGLQLPPGRDDGSMGPRGPARHAGGVPSTALPPKLERRSREVAVFSVAAALAFAHAVDDAFLAGLGTHTLAGVIALAATVAAVLGFPSLRPGVRTA